MLIDVNAVSSIFANLPKGDSERDAVPAAYSKILARGVSKCESLLKVVMSPTEPFEGLVSTYLTIAGPDANAMLFTRILDMKGVPKPNQGVAIDTFNRTAVGLAGGASPQGASPLPPVPFPLPMLVSPAGAASSPISSSAAQAATAAANTAAVAATAAGVALQGALSTSVSTAAQIASAAGKSTTAMSFSNNMRGWLNLGRTRTSQDGPPGSQIGGSPGEGPGPAAPLASPAAAGSSAFAKMAALGQNFLSSAKASPPPPTPPPKS
jgi:hypothetical protein